MNMRNFKPAHFNWRMDGAVAVTAVQILNGDGVYPGDRNRNALA